MRNHYTLNPDEYTQKAQRTHHDLMQATERQLHRAVEHTVEDYRRNRNPAAPLAVNLFPALRVRYGNLLNEELLSAEIVLNNPEEIISRGISHAELVETSRADIAFFFTIAGINESEPVLWDTHDPCQTLPRSLEVTDLMDFVEALADVYLAREGVLFTEHAQSLLISQAKSKQEFIQLEWEMKNEQGMAAFYKRAFEAVVETDKTPTLATIYETLKSAYRLQSTHGIGSEAATTYWLELGEIADEGSGHMLGSLAQSEIESDVRAALEALSEAAQLVLWQEHDGMRNFFDDDYRNAPRARLFHDSDCMDEIVSKVCSWLMGSSIDDWHNRAEKS